MAYKKIFSYDINIDAGSFKYYDFREMYSTDDYLPFRNFTLINTGTTDIKVYINDSNFSFYVPKGTIYQEKGLNIYKMKIVNTDTTKATEVRLIIDNRLSEIDYLKVLVFGKEEVKK